MKLVNANLLNQWQLKSAGHGCLMATLAVALTVGCQQTQQSSTDQIWTPAPLKAEETAPSDGREVVQRMVDFMSEQQELAAEAFVTYEALQDSGQMLHFDMLQRMVLSKPDKLHWKTLRDDASVDLAWIRAGQFSMLKLPSNIWGQVEGPATVAEMVELLASEYELNVPFSDLLASDPSEPWLSGEVTSIVYVGEAWVEGGWSDQVAIRKPGFDIELWVRKGAEPFLAKVVIVFTEAEGKPTYSARFRKWSLEIPEKVNFEFSPPPDSERIEVIPVSQ